MKNLLQLRLAWLPILLLSIFSCNKSEELVTDSVSDYLPLIKGKYITYRLDSMVFTNFQSEAETHRYQLKVMVDDAITDNLGNPTYRINRYIRDSAGTTDWKAYGTYYITPLKTRVETIEDNMRVIKLQMPVKEGFSWKGNDYLPTNPYDPIFGNTFGSDDNMKDWDFMYDTFDATLLYRGNTYKDVWTVEQEDFSDHVPAVLPPSTYASRARSVEKYSKKIGLVYREYTLWEYQLATGNSNNAFSGFGIVMWMIDHN